MNMFTYFALLITGLVFVGCFWPLLIAIIALFDKNFKAPKNNHPKAK